MTAWLRDSIEIVLALGLVALNGFFVAAEFALVKVRRGQLDRLVAERRPFAQIAQWLNQRLDQSLSACQLGITMASLGLGWVGEPAFAHLLEPVLRRMGITSETTIHTVAFVIAFSLITALHLVIGEQAPKIFAIRRADAMILWCAAPLRFFYFLFLPFLLALNASTAWLLKLAGIKGASEHDLPHSEDEIRELVHHAHAHSELTRSEQQLIQAVFRFDDLVCRRVMVPRADIDFFNVDKPVAENLQLARGTKHTRYPLCEGSLDNVLGVIHIKDLVGLTDLDAVDLRSIMREPKFVPETMPVSRLLRHFQATHQLLAFVVDEYGTVSGIVTLENVLEPIIGSVEDEFDSEPPEIEASGEGAFLVSGSTSIAQVNQQIGLELDAPEVDTFAGLLVIRAGRILAVGDTIDLDSAVAEVLEVQRNRATRIRVTPQKRGDVDH